MVGMKRIKEDARQCSSSAFIMLLSRASLVQTVFENIRQLHCLFAGAIITEIERYLNTDII
jgi:hypothetical protein